MYTKHPWVLLLCHMPAIQLLSQTKTDSIRREKNRHFILSWSTGMLFIHKKTGRLGTNFPYYSSNLPSTGQFKSSLGNPFSQDLQFTQPDSAGSRHSFNHRFGLIGLDQPGITATFNGRPINHSPYSLGGLYLGATMGVCIAEWHKQRRQSRW
jgi:hypothetical protein